MIASDRRRNERPRLYRAECEHFLLLSQGDFDGAMRWAHRQIEFERAAGWSQSIGRSNAILAAVTAGRAGEVLDDARAAVAHFEAGRDCRTLAFARYDLTAALLVTGAAAEARDVAWRGWRETGTFGMQAWWADQLALLAALESRPHGAARLAGYADAQYAATGERRDAQRSACLERAMTLAADSLGGVGMWQELKAEGAMLSDGDVVALAFGDARSH